MLRSFGSWKEQGMKTFEELKAGLTQELLELERLTGIWPNTVEKLYWLHRTSVRERDPLGLHHPPLSLSQLVISHRSKRERFLMDKRKHSCMGS